MQHLIITSDSVCSEWLNQTDNNIELQILTFKYIYETNIANLFIPNIKRLRRIVTVGNVCMLQQWKALPMTIYTVYCVFTWLFTVCSLDGTGLADRK